MKDDGTGSLTSGGDEGDGDGDGEGDAEGDGDGEQSAEMPDNDYCAAVSDWDSGHTALEFEILRLTNEIRARGANCGSRGDFEPAPPLTMQSNIHCSARAHSMDMAVRDYFDHDTPEGASPFDRMGEAGYQYRVAGENIAAGSHDAAGTMEQWMESDGHCANVMDPDYTELGVGYFPGGQYGFVWTQNFGSR